MAPLAEWLAQAAWAQAPKALSHRAPASRLTQGSKRGAHGGLPALPSKPAPAPQNLCRNCGAVILHKGIYCRICTAEASKSQFKEAAESGRAVSLTPKAQAQRTKTQRRNAKLQHGWIAANQPSWLDQETYVTKIQPLLARLTVSAIASAIHVSEGYADSIRKGKVHPHARHWLTLAGLVGYAPVVPN